MRDDEGWWAFRTDEECADMLYEVFNLVYISGSFWEARRRLLEAIDMHPHDTRVEKARAALATNRLRLLPVKMGDVVLWEPSEE